MPDTSIVIRDANGVTYPIDVRSIPGGDTRQVLLLGNGEESGLISPATEDTLTAILAELGTKLDAGGTVVLDAASLAALENITATLDAGTLAGLAGAATPTNLPGASGAVTSVDGRLMGLTVREAAGTPAKASMRLRAGGATGAILATVTLAPEESIRDWFGPNGITATGGVYYELVSGTITGGVQTR